MTVSGGKMAALQPSPSTARAVPLPLASRGRQERNADFKLIARQGDTTTLSAKGAVKPKNPPAHWAGQT